MKRIIFALLSVIAVLGVQADDRFWLGADTGWSTEMEAGSKTLYGWSGEAGECTALMKEMGLNAIRIRVLVDPSGHGGWCGMDDVLEKARRAKKLGMEVMIAFCYSDWWTESSKLNAPASWAKHGNKQMQKDVAEHTKAVLAALKAEGISPRWVQVGSGTSNGIGCMTGSIGHMESNPAQYAGFFKAGYEAAKEVFPETSVIVHLDNAFDNDMYNRTLDAMKSSGAKWDMIGMSLYPYWAVESRHEPSVRMTVIDCLKNIRRITKKYDCDVMIVETGLEVDESRPWLMEQGREQLSELIRRCRMETDGRCRGVFYWEPECRPSQYKLGAFTEEGRPTSIMRAMTIDAILAGGGEGVKYDRPLVEICTGKGIVVVELYNETPIHRDNFLRMVELSALDSTIFHRVIKDFMIQCGDPTTRKIAPTSLENPAPLVGGKDFPAENGEMEIPAEFRYPQFFHKRGAMAAAREGEEDNPQMKSSASQFYIVWGKWPAKRPGAAGVKTLDYYGADHPGTPWLDGTYTVFGEVVAGLSVVDAIQQMPTDVNDRPLEDVRIISMKRLR